MKSIEIIGKTYEEALKNGLEKLEAKEEDVDIEILENGSKGFLNLIGSKPTKIKITLKKNNVDRAREFLEKLIDYMGIDAKIEITENDSQININIKGKLVGTIIGHGGETLDSLQYLVFLIINKGNNKEFKRVELDAENYRQKKQDNLKSLAERTAYKVKKSGRPYKLEPMNPYERRIIHLALENVEGIRSYSDGAEPYRRVIVDIKKD